VVGTAGFEPATPCSQSRCADQAAPRPVETAADLRFLFLGGAEAVSIALQHHLNGVLRCRHVGAKATRPDPLLRRLQAVPVASFLHGRHAAAPLPRRALIPGESADLLEGQFSVYATAVREFVEELYGVEDSDRRSRLVRARVQGASDLRRIPPTVRADRPAAHQRWVQLISLDRHGLEMEPRWRDDLSARNIVAPGAAAIDLGLCVARAVTS
jgi:hypothetical protein